jgi:hypothetical protein
MALLADAEPEDVASSDIDLFTITLPFAVLVSLICSSEQTTECSRSHLGVVAFRDVRGQQAAA